VPGREAKPMQRQPANAPKVSSKNALLKNVGLPLGAGCGGVRVESRVCREGLLKSNTATYWRGERRIPLVAT